MGGYIEGNRNFTVLYRQYGNHNRFSKEPEEDPLERDPSTCIPSPLIRVAGEHSVNE
jgi:hypothetical protein